MEDKQNNNPADDAAMHLANLLGTSVAGFTPETSYHDVDLETELFRYNNVTIAALVILSALVKSNDPLKQDLLKILQPNHFWDKSLERFLFLKIRDHIESNASSTLDLDALLKEYGPFVWGEPLSERLMVGAKFTVAQILAFEPNDKLAYQAFELRRQWALQRGFITEDK